MEPNEFEDISALINDLYDSKLNGEEEHLQQKIANDDPLWLKEHERLVSIEENNIREPMESIHVFYIYINKNMYIEKIIRDIQELSLSDDKKFSFLSKEKLLKIIQTKKIKTAFSKYKLIDILKFVVNVDPDNLQAYSKNEQGNFSFFKPVSVGDDLKIDESIFIFHKTNTVYFIFQEVEIINTGIRTTLKSILKPTSNNSNLQKINTKKVRIQVNLKQNYGKATRKHR